MNKLFTDLGRKFKFSSQDSDLEYLFWQCKYPPVSFDLKPPLEGWASILIHFYCFIFLSVSYFSLSVEKKNEIMDVHIDSEYLCFV